MIAGGTGHQKREGIDWNWVRRTISSHLRKASPDRALSSLAEGTDQVFAEAAIALSIPIEAIIPLDDYDRFFSPSGLIEYHRLLEQSTCTSLHWTGDPEHAFLNAGRYIVDNCDLLIAVWDGQAADGVGGTADVVLYAKEQRRKILHLDPCNESVRFLTTSPTGELMPKQPK